MYAYHTRFNVCFVRVLPSYVHFILWWWSKFLALGKWSDREVWFLCRTNICWKSFFFPLSFPVYIYIYISDEGVQLCSMESPLALIPRPNNQENLSAARNEISFEVFLGTGKGSLFMRSRIKYYFYFFSFNNIILLHHW